MTAPHVSRRGFIRTFAGGALGGSLLYAFPEHARARYIIAHDLDVAPQDEEFWGVVRAQFPLRREPLYLNNGTMGPSPYVVIDAVASELEEVDRAGRYGGWEAAREKIAAFVNAEVTEISLTHNVTEGINVVACGLALSRGDEVIMTDHEHVGNALPWLARGRRDGIVIRTFTPAPTASETLNRVNDLITKRTRVIAVPHITCTTGHVLPAREISALGRTKRILVMIDGAHTPGMMVCDLHALGCDFFASCCHKWMMGPKGTGFLYVRRESLDLLEPYWVGGGSDAGWDIRKGTVQFRADAHRFDFASQSSALYVGVGAAVDFLGQLGMENVHGRGKMLALRLRRGLEDLGGKVEILTPEEEGSHASVVGFRLRAIPYDALYTHLLEKKKIITRMVPENGINCNRVSTHIYNSPAEVDRVLEAIRELA